MAELPRYRRDSLLGVVVSDVPTATLQEGVRASQTLTNSMNRVSDFAFKIAEQQAKLEGAEFGALNAPTSKQLEIARKNNKDLESLLPGDRFSVFGSNARAAALDVLTTSMEQEARKSITAFSAAYANETIDLSQLQTGLATIEDQYSALLQDISPAAAVKFRADIGTLGNSAFLSAAQTEADRNSKRLEVQAISQAQLIVDGVEGQVDSLIRTIIKAGDTTNDQGEVSTIEDKIEILARNKIFELADYVRDPAFADKYSAKLDAEVSAAKIDLVTEYLKDDPLNKLPELDQDGAYIQDQAVQRIFGILDAGERAEVQSRVEAYVDDQIAEKDAQEQRDSRRRAERAQDVAVLIHKAVASNNDNEAKVYMSELETLDFTLWKSMTGVVNGSGGFYDDPETVVRLDLKTTLGTLSLTDLNQQFTENRITRSTYDSLFARYQAQRDERYKSGIDYARNLLNYPEHDFVDPQGSQRAAVIKMKLLENEWLSLKDTAMKEGKSPGDPYDFFKRRSNEIKNEGFDPAAIEEAITLINTYLVESNQSIANYASLRIADTLEPAVYGQLVQAKKLLVEQEIVYEAID